jgi:hypothetical protein
VSDEFPTLEAVLVVSNLVLAWRLGLLFSASARIRSESQIATNVADARKSHHELHRAARRRNRAGADVVIAAVLGGALVYAWAAQFDVGAAFYALGAVAFVMLLTSAFAHTRLERALEALRARANPGPVARRGAAKPGAHCAECGAADPAKITGEELGPKLGGLGVDALAICPKCGHIEGRARAGTW